MPRSADDMQLVRTAMLTTPLLDGVPKSAVGRLAASGRVRQYRKGTYLCHQGDDAADVYFLLQGRVEISSTSVTGSRVLHATVDVPQFVGELGVLAEIDRTASVLTLEDSAVWIASADDFLEFLGSEPSAARSLLRVLARQVHSHEAFVDDQQAGTRLVEHAREHLAAQAGIHPKHGQSGVCAAAEERQQLEVVVQHHGHMTGVRRIDGSEPAKQKVRHAHRFVAELAVRPGALALPQQHLVGRHRMVGARLDLCTNGERSIKGQWFRGHGESPLGQ